jgi:hypothetical protein
LRDIRNRKQPIHEEVMLTNRGRTSTISAERSTQESVVRHSIAMGEDTHPRERGR